MNYIFIFKKYYKMNDKILAFVAFLLTHLNMIALLSPWLTINIKILTVSETFSYTLFDVIKDSLAAGVFEADNNVSKSMKATLAFIFLSLFASIGHFVSILVNQHKVAIGTATANILLSIIAVAIYLIEVPTDEIESLSSPNITIELMTFFIGPIFTLLSILTAVGSTITLLFFK